eukprot:12624219-Heterocapsa_arctica.AAC.1
MAEKTKKKPASIDAVLKDTKKKRLPAAPKSLASPPSSAATPSSMINAPATAVDTSKSAAAASSSTPLSLVPTTWAPTTLDSKPGKDVPGETKGAMARLRETPDELNFKGLALSHGVPECDFFTLLHRG